MISLIISTNTFAYSAADSSVLTSASPLLSSAITSGSIEEAQANTILNDAQEMLQTGEVSSLLAQKIKETQNLNKNISVAEALDILIESAESTLSK